MSRSKLFVIFLVFILVGVFAAGFYTFNDALVEKTVKIDEQNIVEKNGEYYLLIDERELILPKKYYDKIELEKYNEYKVKYVYNRLNNDGEVVMLKRYGEQPWGK
ncbi:hypothetical protein U1P98_09190 [Lysinibacillus irui]|uniref:Uncharacterized protein n=1 Tax=Lysinibacillus irui TaxID=2998077 RepID=A0AAJ5RHC4_9BACI|nr:hypothetical protein [Lysinibacillus irui]MEA0554748.1 hypothetical protein [Lysinibacillus irui]MEA0563692.1 hypothetical protein [Lysinibacillus irui]MEA0976463.1 hypothetical protein [Lysinibacillus irui]MEA1042617.1 hypothetical protein [Lysinibacillus irui]WDV05386.1 hypothetical protein OU989_13820 [Lysinibacillus irui]